VGETSRAAYREAFWEAIADSTALRAQLIELVECNTWRELGEKWGFNPPENVRNYVRGPLRRRLEREAGQKAVEFLMRYCGERAL